MFSGGAISWFPFTSSTISTISDCDFETLAEAFRYPSDPNFPAKHLQDRNQAFASIFALAWDWTTGVDASNASSQGFLQTIIFSTSKLRSQKWTFLDSRDS